MTRQEWRNEPDCYAGKTCDKLNPQWVTDYPKHGTEVEGETLTLELEAINLPPGARVAIEIPVCPKCGDPADMNEPKRKQRRWPRCGCGFSWAKWAQGQYS